MCSFEIGNVPFSNPKNVAISNPKNVSITNTKIVPISNTKNVSIANTKKCPFQIRKSEIFKKEKYVIFKSEKRIFFKYENTFISNTKMCHFQTQKMSLFQIWECAISMKRNLGQIYYFSKHILPSIKHVLTFRTYILKFSKHILAYAKHILVLRTYSLKFFKHILAFTKYVLILRTDNNCFLKQVLIFPYRYYLRYRCYRTCQQESSCIKQSRQSYETYHVQNSAWQGEMDIIFEVSPDDSWRKLEAISVVLVFLILPPANIQIAIFVIIWWQNRKKSINLSPINKSVPKVGLSAIPFSSSFRQYFRSLKS